MNPTSFFNRAMASKQVLDKAKEGLASCRKKIEQADKALFIKLDLSRSHANLRFAARLEKLLERKEELDKTYDRFETEDKMNDASNAPMYKKLFVSNLIRGFEYKELATRVSALESQCSQLVLDIKGTNSSSSTESDDYREAWRIYRERIQPQAVTSSSPQTLQNPKPSPAEARTEKASASEPADTKEKQKTPESTNAKTSKAWPRPPPATSNRGGESSTSTSTWISPSHTSILESDFADDMATIGDGIAGMCNGFMVVKGENGSSVTYIG